MDAKRFQTPKGMLARMQMVHLGEIAFRIQFVGLVFVYSFILTFAFTLLYFVSLLAISMASLGLIYLAIPGFGKLWGGAEFLTDAMNYVAKSWVVVVPLTCVMSILSIIGLSFDKNERHVGRIVLSVITALLSGLFVLFAWQGGVTA